MDVDAGSRGDDAAALSREPRVAQILAAVPFVVPFFQRLALFQALIAQDRGDDGGLRPIELRATIRRDRLFEDAYAELSVLDPSKLKGRIQVIFVNEAGHEEAGIDGGGVFKEFLDELTKVAFGDSTCLFSQAEGGTDLVATASAPADLRRLEFCGRVIGKALYERVLVEPRFARFFLNKVLGKYNYFDDLSSLDADLYTHLVRLKRAGADDVAALDLTFELHSNGRDVELCSGGRSTKVDAANRGRYVQLVAHHRLNVECAAPSAAFLRGVRAVVPTRWLRMFDPEELQTLISGDEAPIDVEDWRGHVHYGGGYHASQPIIQWFWDVVTDFDAKERAQLLRFVTSCSRPPLLGFSQLHPLLSIHRVPIQSDDERLPTSGTCMNLLKLPHYSSREALREKLLYAVQNAHGFELS
ncbi:hypothetical protein M885DRAFT_444614 [Pelagophyceae sp. CCMP2097]|nr:hypothetical protein M885DRAFT_444614 [Pelagophyceae sp. CCMP2097]